MLDVGQGDATLIIGPDGTKGLIDAGPPDSGIGRILPELNRLQITGLDWVITSHYDADHLGGLPEVLKGFDQEWDTGDDIAVRGALWDRGGKKFHASFWFDEYIRAIEHLNQRRMLEVGQDFELGDGATATVVLSNGHYNDGTVHHLNPDEENASSVAILIEYGSFRYLTAGDLTGGGFSGEIETKDLETQLAALVEPVDVVHLNHHGSQTSSNDNYLDLLTPELAVISVGTDNDFGHPHDAVIRRLKERSIPYLQTATGTIHIVSDGESFDVAPAPPLP